MRIANPREYVTDFVKITEDQLVKTQGNGCWCWRRKDYRTKDDKNAVTLYSLTAGCYWNEYYKLSVTGEMKLSSAQKALKDCYAVKYQLNGIGAAAYFTDEVEAINFTLKIIELIQA